MNIKSIVNKTLTIQKYIDRCIENGHISNDKEEYNFHIHSLIENNCIELGFGAFSICFHNGKNVFSIINDNDLYKDFLFNNSEINIHIPVVNNMCDYAQSWLCKMHKYEVFSIDQMQDNQVKIFNNLYKLGSIDHDDLEALDILPDSLKKALIIISNYFFENYDLDNLTFDLKPENVGWIDDTIILFDLLYLEQ